jgi:hypothetical protein
LAELRNSPSAGNPEEIPEDEIVGFLFSYIQDFFTDVFLF